MDPFSSPFERDQNLIQERLDFEQQKNIGRKYLPLKPAMTTRQKFTEDNLNALKLREELETLKATFAGKCNGGTVDSMAAEPSKASADKVVSIGDILTAPMQMSTMMFLVIVIVIAAIVMNYYMQVKQWRTLATELALGNRTLSQQLQEATAAK